MNEKTMSFEDSKAYLEKMQADLNALIEPSAEEDED